MSLCLVSVGDRIAFICSCPRSLTDSLRFVGQWAPIVGTGFAMVVSFVEGRMHKTHKTRLHSPEIPSGDHRNSTLPQVREQCNQRRDADGTVAPIAPEQPSSSMTTASPQPPHDPHSRSPSLFLSPTTSRRLHPSTLPVERTSFELQNPPSFSSPASPEDRPR